MHLLMILITFTLVYLLRKLYPILPSRLTFFYFLSPPLLLLMTAGAIASMGTDGNMLGLKAGWFSYFLSCIYLTVVLIILGKLAYQSWRQGQKISTYPQIMLLNQPVYLIETDFPYCAQIGFWNSQLVITRGLLNLLDTHELQAVLAHEQAHKIYHDNFWFFWLGWLRTCTQWLPYSEALWQELLMWRELRADAWGAKQSDSLTLAQSLLKVAQQVNRYLLTQPQLSFSVELSDGNNSRLEQRIDALLNESESPKHLPWYSLGIMFSLIPVVTILLHH